MKFLSELKRCCGGATITTAVEGLQPEENEKEPDFNRSGSSRVVSRGNKFRKTENWKPALHVIAEDKTIGDVDCCSYNQRTVGISGNKRVSKVAVKSGRASKRLSDGYWKMSSAIAMPAFSGMIF
ncbi:hypothetical protein HAX54_052685 [Datura stramonium]|uniref:Uncharacterized protein n=1 Tax=Datura stramonium TaxID=4076 RepID=A0ABS8WSG8_DATST|nr:hypothetical protein [Datura stramonium]